MGDVGRTVTGRPGYMGYVPSYELLPITTKFGPAIRVDAKSRKDKCQSELDASQIPDGQVKRNLYIPQMSGTVYGNDFGHGDKFGAYHRKKLPVFAANKPTVLPPMDGLKTHKSMYSHNLSDHQGNIETRASNLAKSQSLKKPLGKSLREQQLYNACSSHSHYSRGKPKYIFNARDVCKFERSIAPKTSSYQRDIGGRGVHTDLGTTTNFSVARKAERPHDRCSWQNERDAFANTTLELQAGTSKISTLGKVKTHHISGYMGKVPEQDINLRKSVMIEEDSLRAYARDNLKNSTLQQIPGYSGFVASSVTNDRVIAQPTTTQNAKDYPEWDSKYLSKKEHGRTKQVLNDFFTVGTGQDGIGKSEMFYKFYKPLEGLPRYGAPNERKWIPDNELRRAYY